MEIAGDLRDYLGVELLARPKCNKQQPIANADIKTDVATKSLRRR